MGAHADVPQPTGPKRLSDAVESPRPELELPGIHPGGVRTARIFDERVRPRHHFKVDLVPVGRVREPHPHQEVAVALDRRPVEKVDGCEVRLTEILRNPYGQSVLLLSQVRDDLSEVPVVGHPLLVLDEDPNGITVTIDTRSKDVETLLAHSYLGINPSELGEISRIGQQVEVVGQPLTGGTSSVSLVTTNPSSPVRQSPTGFVVPRHLAKDLRPQGLVRLQHPQLVDPMAPGEPPLRLARSSVGPEITDSIDDDVNPPPVALGSARQLVPLFVQRPIPTLVSRALQDGPRRTADTRIAGGHGGGPCGVTFDWGREVHAEMQRITSAGRGVVTNG